MPHLHRDWAHSCPHLHWDWVHPTHICARPACPSPYVHWDWAHACHICGGTGASRDRCGSFAHEDTALAAASAMPTAADAAGRAFGAAAADYMAMLRLLQTDDSVRLRVVRCMLRGACCMLRGACCMLRGACCMLSVHAAWGLLQVARYMLRGVCRMLHAAWYLLHAL